MKPEVAYCLYSLHLSPNRQPSAAALQYKKEGIGPTSSAICKQGSYTIVRRRFERHNMSYLSNTVMGDGLHCKHVQEGAVALNNPGRFVAARLYFMILTRQKGHWGTTLHIFRR